MRPNCGIEPELPWLKPSALFAVCFRFKLQGIKQINSPRGTLRFEVKQNALFLLGPIIECLLNIIKHAFARCFAIETFRALETQLPFVQLHIRT